LTHTQRALVVCAMAFLVCLFTQCVRDYRGATQETIESVIVGGSYTPGHYTTSCDSDDKGHTTCHPVWVSPSWSLEYFDAEGPHSETVDEKTYVGYPIGSKVYVSFWQGHVLGLRYGVRFWMGRPILEAQGVR